jgi:hypothetical protein
VTRFQFLSCNANDVGSNEPRKAVKCVNAQRGITGLLLLGHRICESAFEGNQFRPAYPKLTDDPVTLHTVRSINGFGTADKHFLGVTSAQRTGPAERTVIDDGNCPFGLSDPRTYDLGGGARSDHH